MQYEKFDGWKMYITFTRTVAMSSAAHLYFYNSFKAENTFSYSHHSTVPSVYPCHIKIWLLKQLISPESPDNGHRSNPCAWMHIHGQNFRWARFHPGKTNCRGCCHVACAEPGKAGHAAGTEHYSTPPFPLHYVLLGRRCCGGWLWCSGPCGWCGEGSNAQPRK